MSEPPVTIPTPSEASSPTTVQSPLPASSPAPTAARAPRKRRKSGLLTLLLAVAAVAGLLLLWHWHGRETTEGKEATMAVAKVQREDLAEDLWLTAEFHPFQEVALHSKVTGFLKSITVDYGDHVQAGQKIAELEVPELEDELAKARSAYQASLQEVKRTEADFTQADVIYQRLLTVSKDHPKLVAQQEIDDARNKRDAMKGALGAAQQHVDESQSEVNKTKALLDYTTITVPFEGVITRRYVDPGALIQAGTSSSSQSAPIVDVAQQSLLRLVFPVPESAVPIIRDGAPVEIAVTALKETFPGKIARFAGKVERSTRTMHTEVDVPNPDGRYTPGMYAFVRIILQEAKHAIAAPIQAVTRGEQPSVFVVNKEGVIEERPVTLGMQTPDKVEVRGGLAEGELVILGRHNGARPGQKVATKLIEPPKSGGSNPATL